MRVGGLEELTEHLEPTRLRLEDERRLGRRLGHRLEQCRTRQEDLGRPTRRAELGVRGRRRLEGRRRERCVVG